MTEPAALPAEGDLAPDVSLPRDGGGTVTLSDIDGPVVLFFYPKDNTPGCTTEAIGFTEMLHEFAASGATVLGISKDSIKKHDNFVAKHGLKIALLSDADSDTCERFGTWKSKQMYGKTFMGIERSTFLIADGKIAKVWRKVKVAGHVEDVLASVQAL